MRVSVLCLSLCAALAGCGSLTGQLENRIACTVDNDKLFVVSEYGPIGIASKIADADRLVICVK